MAVVKLKIGKLVGPHRTVQVFDGQDADHLALCGSVTMGADGAALLARVVGLARPHLPDRVLLETEE